MIEVLLAGLGGLIGAMLRYLLSGWIYKLLHEPLFPYGTLTVNALGCLLIGLLMGLAEGRGLFSRETRVFLFIGLIGSLTTFSTFGYETFQLMRDGQFGLVLGNVLLQVLLGLGGVWLGDAWAKALILD